MLKAYPGFSPGKLVVQVHLKENIPAGYPFTIYIWVERDNCGENALSRGIRTEWDSNPRPSDYKSRTRTIITTPQCSLKSLEEQ